MPNPDTMNIPTDKKIIVLCDQCFQKLRIPKSTKKQRIRCPNCKHEFDYKYNIFGLSASSKKYFLVGLAGGLLGFLCVEALNLVFLNKIEDAFTASLLATGGYGAGLGAVMGASEGFFRKNRDRMLYGLKIGAVLGLIGGAISGLLAQFAFGLILSPTADKSEPTLALLIFARTVGWGILGLLIGGSYGIKENTSGDLKFGLIGGIIGGVIGGVLFDPISSIIIIGGGAVGRLVGFTVLGITVSVAINHFREVAIGSNRPEMYRQLTRRLPPNLRLPAGERDS